MTIRLTADDLMPLVASLTEVERIRLIQWIALQPGPDVVGYTVASPTADEFTSEDEPLAWDAEGWQEFH